MNTNCINDETTIRLDSNGRASCYQRRDTDGNESGCRDYAKGIPGPESPESEGLQHRAYSANHKGRKENPGQITLGLSARHSNDRRCRSHCRHAGHDILESVEQRFRMAWPLVRLIEEVFVYLHHSEYQLAAKLVLLD